MVQDLITGIIFYDVDNDASNKYPMMSVPTNLPSEIRMRVENRMDTLRVDDIGATLKVSIVPFPSLDLKALVKYIKWSDKTRPSGVVRSLVGILFKEADDLIFYKYKEDLALIFTELEKKIFDTSKVSKINVAKELNAFQTKIVKKLEELCNKELAIKETECVSEAKGETIYVAKVVVCGDMAVGKTSLVLKFTDNAFKREYIPTLGVNISKKIVQINKKNVRLLLWDVGGQQKFEMIRRNAYMGAEAIIFVIDLTQPKSLESLPKWYDEAKRNYKRNQPIKGLLLGNKCDLIQYRKISEKDLQVVSKKFELKYYETSALDGKNVIEAFHEIAENVLETKSQM